MNIAEHQDSVSNQASHPILLLPPITESAHLKPIIFSASIDLGFR
jgi:hypothetical protein